MNRNLPGKRMVASASMLSLVAAAVTAMAAGCLDRPIEPNEPVTSSTIIEKLPQTGVDKIDILLAIDNSASMTDKQQILGQAVPDLVLGLVNPKCIDGKGAPLPDAQQPQSPADKCPAGSKRDFPPVVDIHIGIVDSSLGGHGSDPAGQSCTPDDKLYWDPTQNDNGELIDRPATPTSPMPATYSAKSKKTADVFLAWDPTEKKDTPPGESELGDAGAPVNTGLIPTLRDMVLGVGQKGCGYESQLESWYRFLVDPSPPASVQTADVGQDDAHTVQVGTNQTLLHQRAEFMRPSSLLAIIMLTDENDCSIKESDLGFLIAGPNGIPAPPTKPCATNPNDPCCDSCGFHGDGKIPKGCKNDMLDTCSKPFDDYIYMQCYQPKRRFGLDVLTPLSRYVDGLTNPQVPDRDGSLVANPIFAKNPNYPKDVIPRTADLVFLAGIIGVPWQDIARDPNDLTKGFKNSDELLAPVPGGEGNTWDYIVGDPEGSPGRAPVPPLDPFMVEGWDARSGKDFLTGASITPVGGPDNPINGHEYTVTTTADGSHTDLQYACTFTLPPGQDRTCTASDLDCDCTDATNDKPLCDPTNRLHQIQAKGYPGLRQLGVLKGLGPQGVVGSICPGNTSDASRSDFGYRPAVAAIIERLKTKLGGQCLPKTLTPDKDGEVQCLIIEAKASGGDASCNACNATARQPVDAKHQTAVDNVKIDKSVTSAGLDCFCEITQVKGADLTACLNDPNDPPVNASGQQVDGWCYVDATVEDVDPHIVSGCPATEQRLIRLVGKGAQAPGSILYITCAGT